MSFVLGAALANIYYHIDPEVSKGFTTTLALFPPCICVIMLLLSKSAGSGIAAIGAFALLRYKSAPGTAREFLTAVSPQYAVISTGNERPADARLLVDLAALNIQNCTTMGGSIATVSDGDSITVSYLE